MSDNIDFIAQDLQTQVLDWVFDLTHKELVKETNINFKMMDHQYQRFFKIIAEEFFDVDSDYDGIPPRIAGFGSSGSWKALSNSWQELKLKMSGSVDDIENFYSGITQYGPAPERNRLGAARQGKKRLKNGFKRPLQSKVEPFERYMNKLARDPDAVGRIFGHLAIKYYFGAAGATMTPVMSDRELKQIISKGAKGRFVTMPSRFQMGTEITAFQGVQGVTFDEWHVVDYILKQRDPQNEKQWVKINSRYGFGRSHRPTRAMITPLIAWYMQVGLPNMINL